MASPYSFRPMTADDLPMVAAWLESPHVTPWWRDPEVQRGLVAEDLGNPLMRQWIVALDGRPFAYVQDYEAHSWPQPHLAHLPDGTRVIDTFIGPTDLAHIGHGGRYLRALAERLLVDGASCVAIDPDADNTIGRRAFARAGFVERGEVETDEGRVAVMVFEALHPSP